jgi:zinc transport system permease protein
MIDLWHTLTGFLSTSWLFSWAQYAFMQDALLAVLLTCPLFALLGCLVINNQMAFFSDAIGHAALTGIAIGVLLGLGNPLWSMIGFAVLLALVVSALRRRCSVSADTIIGLTMSFTVALGVVLLSRNGGFGKYSRFLIGDLLTISTAELKQLVVMLIIVLALWTVFFNRIFFVTVSRSLALSRGVNVWLTEVMFAIVVAVVVTVSIPWVGLLVINSLLILPAATSRNIAQNTPQYLLGAVVVSLFSGVMGLICSYYWGTATGATIVLVCMFFFALSALVRKR